MESKSKENFNDLLKKQTIKILQHFISGDNDDSLKWMYLKEYQSEFLHYKNYSRSVVTSYTAVVSTLLDSLEPTLFSEKRYEQLFDEIFLEGVHHDAFMILAKRLDKKKCFEHQKVIELLQKFLQTSSMESLLLYQCVSHDEWDLKYVSNSSLWNDLITVIISLPERIANSTNGQFIKLFSPQFYIPLLLSSVLKVMSHIHHHLKNSQDCSAEFLAKLVGRICIIGSADIVAKKLSVELIKVSEKDFIWRRISQNFISKLPYTSLESFITNLLLVIPWYGYVEWLLGDAGVKSETLKYMMTVKLLFIRTFKQVTILQNIIGYFASSKDRAPQFLSILNSLLDSWVDERALKHQNIEQKTYIASALMICAGWIRKMKPEFDSKAHINKILKGTQLRLGSSEESVRSLGMIIGEHLISAFEPDSPSLKFEFRDIEQLNHFKSLLEIPPKPEDDILLYEEDLKCFDEVEVEKKKWDNNLKEEENKNASAPNTELDSDDDLEPYDLSIDVPKADAKHPLYIRDCMKGLMEQENAEWTEQCLKHAEELIKKNPYAVQEVAEEMAKIVLHLDDAFAIPDFLIYRHRILIALTVQCPVVVANYLISQFSARDYNIRQRLDILEVLAASSSLLSHSTISVVGTEPNVSKKNFIAKREESWKLIVSQRLEAKTRRISKTPKSEIVLTENKFSAVAGNFLYPLLNSCDRKNKIILNLFRENNYVLGRFIYTLGIIMFSASNSLNCRQIATTLLQFLVNIRNHDDVFVRQSVIFAIAAAYMSVPPSILLEDMLPYVLDTNEWLKHVALKDHENGCVEKAIYTISIFQGLAAEESLLHR